MSARGSVAVTSEALHIPMRDGVRLSVHVQRPATDESVPAIISYTPYRKGRLGGHHPIVEHGYATVTFDIRGTGSSGGCNTSIYSAPERQDGYDMIEWAAAQPWCNGSVGMWGISFGAVVAIQMAGAAPPHLKAVIARSGSDDPYWEWTNPGGSPRPYIYLNYAPIMAASNFSPPDPEEVGERWAELWAERLEGNVPWGVSFAEELADGPFWRERAIRGRYDDVRCAVFVVGGWADWYADPLLRIFEGLKVPKRALIGPWSHQWPDGGIPGPRIDWLGEAVKWFDQWLKGVDTGVMDEPPVTVFVREFRRPASVVAVEAGEFRCEADWPVPGVEARRMLLGDAVLVPNTVLSGTRADGAQPGAAVPHASPRSADRLECDARAGVSTGYHGGGPLNVNYAMAQDQRVDEHLSLVYTSAELAEDLEVAGRARAELFVAFETPVALVAVKVCDVAPDGTSALVARGVLNVAHRDAEAPPTEVVPGEVYRIEVECLACAYRFAAGHRVRLCLAGADCLNAWGAPQAGAMTVHRGAETQSALVLPVVPAGREPMPAPALETRESATEEQLRAQAPELTFTQDFINGTVTAAHACSYGPDWRHKGRLTVSAREPWRTEVCSDAQRAFDFPGRRIEVDARCVTSSDREAFHHTTQVNITMNGAPYFSRSWAVSRKRELF